MNRSEIVSLTTSLVEIASHEDETAVGDEIESWLRTETSGSVRRDTAGNVIARRQPTESANREDRDEQAERDTTEPTEHTSLALVGHHDVVPPAERQVNESGDYRVEAHNGRLYGRGTADMKGPLAAAMLAFRDAEPQAELVFASFVGEEQGGLGAQQAIEEGFAPTRAIVVEGSTGYSAPGVLDVAVAHKGRRGSTITATGRAGHASRPEAADNAVYRACDAIEIVRSLEAPETTVLDNTLAGSVAVTEIDGGSAWNVIPERCTVTIDERTVPGETAALDQVESVEGVEWTVDQELPSMACGDSAFANRVCAAATAVQPGKPELVAKPHATDAGWLSSAGTDCVVCGAAEPGEAHTADESVSIEVLAWSYELYRRVASAKMN